MKTIMSVSITVLALLAGTSLAAEPTDAVVYVVHGVPGQDLGPEFEPNLPVDISLNTTCVVPGLVFGTVTEGLNVAPGLYTVRVSMADQAKPGSGFPYATTDVNLAPADNVTIVAHLNEYGWPMASVFHNACTTVAPSVIPLVFHQTAASPPVDFRAMVNTDWGRQGLIVQGASNGVQAGMNAWPQTWDLSISPTNVPLATTALEVLTLEAGKAYHLYAVGSQSMGSLTIIQHVIPAVAVPEIPAISEVALSGTVRGQITGWGIGGVKLTFSNNGGTATTDDQGRYKKNVPYGWSGVVTLAAQGFAFSPDKRSYTEVQKDLASQDYAAIWKPF